jgi:hypothetical protein
MADFAPITAEERANNKANRLKHAASPADGLTVRVLDKRHANTSFASRGVEPGAVVILSRDSALQAIKDGHAESAE